MKRILLVLFALLLLVTALAIFLHSEKMSIGHKVTFSDGSTMTLKAVTHGTQHRYCLPHCQTPRLVDYQYLSKSRGLGRFFGARNLFRFNAECCRAADCFADHRVPEVKRTEVRAPLRLRLRCAALYRKIVTCGEHRQNRKPWEWSASCRLQIGDTAD
jgi:hypothetical protein